jgi:hypothetical protein
MLYAESPNGLASQQMAYDNYYTGANENNASRYDAAQARAVENILRQQQADAEAQRFADENAATTSATGTANAFTASENQKARDAQFALYGNKGGVKSFEDMIRVIDYAPSDPKQLAIFTQGMAPGDAAKYQIMVQQRDKMIAANKQQQVDKQTAIDAPQNQAATEGAVLAGAGNLYNRATADTAAIAASPTQVAHWYNPRWSAAIQPENIIQPSDHAKALMATLRSGLAPQITPGAIAAKDSTLQVNPVTGNLEPRYQTTPSYRPPVILPSNPAPVAPPPIQAAPPPSPVPLNTAAILPLPLLATGKVDAGQLVSGRMYQTKRGPALWDGKQFSQ